MSLICLKSRASNSKTGPSYVQLQYKQTNFIHGCSKHFTIFLILVEINHFQLRFSASVSGDR